MANKKEAYKPIGFAIKDGDFAGKYQIKRSQVNIPSVGIVSAADLAKEPKMLEELVRINSGVIVKLDK